MQSRVLAALTIGVLVIVSGAAADTIQSSLTIDTASYPGLYLKSGDTSFAAFRVDLPVGYVEIGDLYSNAPALGLRLFTNDLERLRIDQNGNVGVGTSPSAYRFEVSGDGAFSKDAPYQLTLQNSSGGSTRTSGINLRIDSTNLWQLITDNSSGNDFFLQFNGSASQRFLSVSTDGNVGIGTSNPGYKLEVAGGLAIDDFGTLSLRRGQGPGCYAIHFANVGPRHPLRFVGSADATTHRYFEFGYYEGENQANPWHAGVVIDSYAGNVGIGTTSPSHKLSVNGTIKAKEVIVETSGWSDYVFADDYRLAPLSEVEAHIKAERQLPGIPSEQQVAEQGVSVGEMQAALLAKIEELTLHVIRQEKRIDRLEAENEQLRKSTHIPGIVTTQVGERER